eukprot:8265624-Alexandrium_andersonii.AAC.1
MGPQVPPRGTQGLLRAALPLLPPRLPPSPSTPSSSALPRRPPGGRTPPAPRRNVGVGAGEGPSR